MDAKTVEDILSNLLGENLGKELITHIVQINARLVNQYKNTVYGSYITQQENENEAAFRNPRDRMQNANCNKQKAKSKKVTGHKDNEPQNRV